MNTKSISIINLNVDKDNVMGLYGILPIDMLTYESIILGGMLAPGDKNPPIAWSTVSFFDVDYENDIVTLIPYDVDDENIYTIHNPVGGEMVEGVGAKVMALSSMLFFVGYLLEKRNNTVLLDLYSSIRALAYSAGFLDKQEQKHFFNLTD